MLNSNKCFYPCGCESIECIDGTAVTPQWKSAVPPVEHRTPDNRLPLRVVVEVDNITVIKQSTVKTGRLRLHGGRKAFCLLCCFGHSGKIESVQRTEYSTLLKWNENVERGALPGQRTQISRYNQYYTDTCSACLFILTSPRCISTFHQSHFDVTQCIDLLPEKCS